MAVVIVPVVLAGVALLGTGGALSYYIYKKNTKPELDNFDAVIVPYDETTKKVIWEEDKPIVGKSIGKKSFNLQMAIIGKQNHGKTFLLNGLTSDNFESQHTKHTKGLSLVANSEVIPGKEVLFVDTEGTGSLPKGTGLDRLKFLKKKDEFMQILVSNIADLVVLVHSEVDTDLLEAIRRVCEAIVDAGNFPMLIVVHNCKSISNKRELKEYLQHEILETIAPDAKAKIFSDLTYHEYSMIVKGKAFKLVHLILGEQTELKTHNKGTIKILKHLMAGQAKITTNNQTFKERMDAVLPNLVEEYFGGFDVSSEQEGIPLMAVP